jgi:hypothetical protein
MVGVEEPLVRRTIVGVIGLRRRLLLLLQNATSAGATAAHADAARPLAGREAMGLPVSSVD